MSGEAEKLINMRNYTKRTLRLIAGGASVSSEGQHAFPAQALIPPRCPGHARVQVCILLL